jgi:hypothetical protein
MSYWTNVRIGRSGDGSITEEQLLAAAREYLAGFAWYAVDDIVECLAEGLRTGATAFCDLRVSDFSELFLAISQRFPGMKLRISGNGEESGDDWALEFLGGKQLSD